MNLGEYIKTYRRNNAALTLAEAKIAGIRYPLESGWFKKNKLMEVDVDAMVAARARRAATIESRRAPKDKINKKVRKAEKALRKALSEAGPSAIHARASINATETTFSDAQYKYANDPAFLQSFEWRQLRFKVLQKYGSKCQCCGSTPAGGAVMNVDHIRPRRKFPQLALDIDNLQVLCGDCNHGKGNAIVDFRLA